MRAAPEGSGRLAMVTSQDRTVIVLAATRTSSLRNVGWPECLETVAAQGHPRWTELMIRE
jgi:hypothetical protein